VWTIISLLNPHSFAWQVTYEFPWLKAVAILTIAGFLVFSSGGVKRILTMEVGLMLVLWAWFTFTTIHNTSQSEFITFRSDTWYRWRFVSKIMLMSVMMIAIVDTWERFRRFLLVVCACLAILVIRRYRS